MFPYVLNKHFLGQLSVVANFNIFARTSFSFKAEFLNLFVITDHLQNFNNLTDPFQTYHKKIDNK